MTLQKRKKYLEIDYSGHKAAVVVETPMQQH